MRGSLARKRVCDWCCPRNYSTTTIDSSSGVIQNGSEVMHTRRIILILFCVASVSGAVFLLHRSISWDELEKASTVFVNVALVTGAIAAIFKFQLYNLLGHRWRSELDCTHHLLSDGSTVFVAEYTISNTGQRPLHLSEVRMRLLPASTTEGLVVPITDRVLAARTMVKSSPLRGLFQVEPGERSIFTLRCSLPELDDMFFIDCTFDLAHQRVPAAFTRLYVKDTKVSSNTPVPITRERIRTPAIFTDE